MALRGDRDLPQPFTLVGLSRTNTQVHKGRSNGDTAQPTALANVRGDRFDVLKRRSRTLAVVGLFLYVLVVGGVIALINID